MYSRIFAVLLCLLLLPFYSQGSIMLNAGIQTRAEIMSFLNLALFITSLISIKQFFWPGGNNTLPFQVFNIAFAVLFYAISLPFLIANRQYYEEYQNLIPLEVLSKFFLSINISSFAQWVIIASVVINILYILRYRTDYYQAGIATAKETPQEILQESMEEHEKEIEEEMIAEQETDPLEESFPYKSSELSDEDIEEIERTSSTEEDDITHKNV